MNVKYPFPFMNEANSKRVINSHPLKILLSTLCISPGALKRHNIRSTIWWLACPLSCGVKVAVYIELGRRFSTVAEPSSRE